jgi:predicted nucleic acid-binding protein
VKVLLDLNVLLDVLQRREPHYAASAAVLSRIAAGEMEGAVPGHALTTLYYVLFRLADRKRAIEAVDWLLAELEIVPEGREVFLRARSLDMDDFEDAEARGCTRIVTRNVADFEGAPVPAVSPRELDAELA